MNHDSQISSADQAPASTSDLPKKTSSPRFMGILCWAVTLIAIAVLAWAGQKYLSELETRITAENQHLAVSLYKTQKALAQQEVKTQLLQQQLNLFESQNQMRAAWFLSKAEYLAKLASFVLVFQNDVITAKKILNEADLQLQSLNDPQIWPVRKAIAQDLAALNAINPVDLPGVVSKLDVISQQVEQLPRIPRLIINPEALKSQKEKTPSNFFDKLKHLSLAISENLKGLFEIQYDAPLAAPLLPPDQYLQIVNNIQFQLTMAQWAALHQQAEIYQQSLARAKAWIARYYSGADVAVKSILSNLTVLEKVAIHPQVPDLSHSLQALQDALAKN